MGVRDGLLGYSVANKSLCQSGRWKGTGTGDLRGVGTSFMTGVGGYYNRITRGYSCPAGLVANLTGGIQIGGCYPCLWYVCSLP